MEQDSVELEDAGEFLGAVSGWGFVQFGGWVVVLVIVLVEPDDVVGGAGFAVEGGVFNAQFLVLVFLYFLLYVLGGGVLVDIAGGKFVRVLLVSSEAVANGISSFKLVLSLIFPIILILSLRIGSFIVVSIPFVALVFGGLPFTLKFNSFILSSGIVVVFGFVAILVGRPIVVAVLILFRKLPTFLVAVFGVFAVDVFVALGLVIVCFEGVGLAVLFCAEFWLLVVPFIIFAGFILILLIFFIGERIGSHFNSKIGRNSDIVFANTIFIIFILTYFRIIFVVFIVVLAKTNSSIQIPVFLTDWFVVFIAAVLVLAKSRGK